MPRVNYVKKAQKRYETKPVLDEQGNPKRVPVSKKTKSGREVTRAVTVRDLDKPLPNLRCDFPGCDIDGGEILPGTPYKYIKLRFGQRNRHEAHPSWNHWEYSSSVAAQAARVQQDMHEAIDSWEPSSPEDFDAIKDELEQMAQDFLDEREEALGNMPEQLQDGSQAQEYVDLAEEWVREFDGIEVPEYDDTCLECEGTGTVASGETRWYARGPEAQDLNEEGFDTEDDANAALDAYLAEHPEMELDEADAWDVVSEDEDEEDCDQCEGEGVVTEEVSEDWIEQARDALREAVDGAQF